MIKSRFFYKYLKTKIRSNKTRKNINKLKILDSIILMKQYTNRAESAPHIIR